MPVRFEFRRPLVMCLAALLACPPARALVTLNDSHDHVFVTGSVGVTWDSNVFANSDGKGDYAITEGVALEYTRRAGWIGVNVNLNVDGSRFGKLTEQDFLNPRVSLELTKQTGRTTGSFTLSAARESRADAAVSLRTSSWNYNAGLNFKYPIVGAYTLAGQLGYAQRKYSDETVFTNLSTYSLGLDLFHILSTERDMIVGYRYRHGQTSRNTSSSDQSLSVGVNGKIIRGIKGAVRAGYQVRTIQGGPNSGAKFGAWTASGSASYSLNKKATFSGAISKDFSTTATDSSVDTTTLSGDFQYAYNSRWSFTSSAAFGDSKFLGQGGRVILFQGRAAVVDPDTGLIIDPAQPAILGAQRHDDYVTWSAALNYSLNEHFKVSFSYTWFKNWSTVAYADFIRSSWTLSASSRW